MSTNSTNTSTAYRITSTYNDLTLQGNTSTPYILFSSDEYAFFNYYSSSFGHTADTTFMKLDRGAFTTFDGIPMNGTGDVALAPNTYTSDALSPYVTNFDMNMDTGDLTLHFSEPIAKYGESNPIFHLTGIALQGQEGLTSYSSTSYVALQDYGEETFVSATNYARTITMNVGYTNMNNIKKDSIVGRSAAKTWLSLTTSVANDTFGNPLSIVGMDIYGAMEISTFTADATAPTLLYWDYEVFSGKATLTFSEVIDVVSFNYSNVYFTSTSNSSSTKIYIGGDGDVINKATVDAAVLDIELSTTKYNSILDMNGILSNESNSYLVIKEGTFMDVAKTQNIYNDPTTNTTHARRVRSYLPDTVQPELEFVELDMSNQTIKLRFTKNVAAASVDLSLLILQSQIVAGGGTEVFTFDNTSATIVGASVDSNTLKLQLTEDTFKTLKATTTLALSSAGTFVSIATDFIQDKAATPNKVVGIPQSAAFQVNSYIPDEVRPLLSSWDIDMNTGIMTLNYNEAIKTDSIDLTQITLYSDSDYTASDTKSFTLVNTSLVSNTDGTLITQLTDTELNFVKTYNPLCVMRTTCFLSHTSSLGNDTMTTNTTSGDTFMNKVASTSVQMASGAYAADVTPPQIESFVMDLNDQTVIITMSEPIISATWNSPALRFYPDPQDLYTNHSLTQSSYLHSMYLNELKIKLSLPDYVAIKAMGACISGNGTDDCSLVYGSNLVTDVAGNTVNITSEYGTIVNNVSYVYATSIVDDAVKPAAVAIYVVNDRNLSIYFDDFIELNSVDLTSFYIYSSASGNLQSLLSSEIKSSSNTSKLDINMASLYNDLVGYNLIGQSNVELFLSSANIFRDIPSQNPNEAMSTSTAIPDGQQMLFFRLDLSAFAIRVALVIPDDYYTMSSYDQTQFRLQSTTNLQSVTFTSAEVITIEDGISLKIAISNAVFATITSTMDVSDKDTLQLIVGQTAMTDSNSKTLASGFTLNCEQIIVDQSAPELQSYSVDLDAGNVLMYFTKPILLSTLSLDLMTLINSQSSAASTQIGLSNAGVTTTATITTSIELNLNNGNYPTIRDSIHLAGDIGTSTGDIFLQLGRGAIGDTSVPTNFLAAVAAANATAPSVLTADTTNPTMTGWTFDMNSQILTVTYDEAVDHTTALPAYYRVLKDPDDSTSAQRYLLSSTVTSSTGYTVSFAVSNIDKNQIGLLNPNLCTSASNCYLAVKANSIRDISTASNLMEEVLFKYAEPVTTYTADATAPVLQSWNISMQTRDMYLRFDEVIDCSTVDLSTFRLQPAAYLADSSSIYYYMSYTSVDCTAFTGAITKELYASIDITDFNLIKAQADLWEGEDSTYLGKGAAAVTDLAGNTFVDITTGYGEQVLHFTPDTIRPNLISFTITSAKILVLYFDEPVDAVNINVESIQFQSSLPPYIDAFNLSAATVTSYSTDKMSVSIALSADYDTITSGTSIFSSQANTYLTIYDSAATDAVGNAVISVPESDAKPLGPSIIAWDFNSNTGALTLKTSEAVKANFDVVGLEFQRNISRQSGTDYVTLTTNTTVNCTDSTNTTFQVTLNRLDLNSLKYYDVVQRASTSFLVAYFGVAESVVQATLIPYLSTAAITSDRAMLVRTLTLDTTAPIIESFGKDLNIGHLYIRFDEPVETSTFDPSGLSVVSSSSGGSAVLTGSDSITLVNLTTIDIDLTTTDFNNLKIAEAEGALDVMVVAANSAYDMRGNAYAGNTELTPIPEKDSAADSTPPVLTAVHLNLQTGILVLTFDEVIDSDKFDARNITIMSTATYASSTTFTLTQLTLVEVLSTGDISLDLKSYKDDFISFGALSGIGTSTSDTYIQYAAIPDMFGNLGAGVLQATKVTADTTPLVLMSYRITGTSNYQLDLYFNKLVPIASFVAADFTLASDNDTSTNTVNVADADTTMITTDTYSVSISTRINSGTTTANAMAALPNALVDYIYIASTGSTVDIYGNTLLAQAPIKKGPRVSRWVLDMQFGELFIVFTQPMDLTANFNLSALGFYSAASESYYMMNGESGTTLSLLSGTSNPSVVGSYTFAADELNALKGIDVQEDSIYLVVEKNLISESNTATVPTFEPVYTFMDDTTKPVLLNITADIGNAKFVLTFDEPIRSTSVVITNFRIQSTASSITNSLVLSGGGGTITSIGREVNLFLSSDDMSYLMLQPGLADSITNTFVSFSASSAADYAGNTVRLVSTTSARQADIFLNDTSRPSLQSYDLDLSTGILELHFSEPIDVSSLDMTKVSIMSRSDSSRGGNYTLTSTTALDGDGKDIRVQVSDEDIHNMKNIDGLIRSGDSTYLIINATAATDLQGNQLLTIKDGSGKAVDSYVGDTSAPTVDSITLNMEENYLLFNMSELIRTSSVDVTQIQIAEMYSGSSQDYSLTTSSQVDVNTTFTTQILVRLSSSDANTIKYRNPMGLRANTSYLSFTSTFVQDSFGNNVQEVPTSSPVITDVFIADTSPPVLQAFTLDMDAGTIALTFDESVKSDNMDLTQLTLQSRAISAQGTKLVLNESSFHIDADIASKFLTVTQTSDQMAYLKYNSIAIRSNESFLAWTTTFMSDQFNNFALPKWDASVYGYTPAVPTTYTADVTSPTLSRFIIDRTNLVIVMEFDEPILINNASLIHLYTSTTGNSRMVLGQQLDGSTGTYSDYSRKVSFNFYTDVCNTSNVTSYCRSTLFETNLNLNTVSFYMGFSAGAFQDFAVTANQNAVMNAYKKESSADCSDCPSGEYIKTACTTTEDRVCTACTTCATGKYQRDACTIIADTTCKECSSCEYGKYISTACQDTADTICSTCSVCSKSEYITSVCLYGIDTACATCESCNLPTDYAKKMCASKGNYEWWYNQNCCYDADGIKVECSQLDKAEMAIHARSGRHHWVFEDDSVDSSLYGFGMTY